MFYIGRIILFFYWMVVFAAANASFDVSSFEACRYHLSKHLCQTPQSEREYASLLPNLSPGGPGYAVLPMSNCFMPLPIAKSFRSFNLPMHAFWNVDEQTLTFPRETLSNPNLAFALPLGKWVEGFLNAYLETDEFVRLRTIEFRLNSPSRFAGAMISYQKHQDNSYFTASISLVGAGTTVFKGEGGEFIVPTGDLLLINGSVRQDQRGVLAPFHSGTLLDEDRWTVIFVFSKVEEGSPLLTPAKELRERRIQTGHLNSVLNVFSP